MNSRILAFLLGVLVVGAIFLVFKRNSPASSPAQDAEVIAAKILGNLSAEPSFEPSPTMVVPTPAAPGTAADSVHTANPRPVIELMPSREALRAAVTANPHSPPEIMIRFTLELYAKQQEAMKSQSNAESFFRELEGCVADRNGTEQAQALCLINAKRVQEKYSSLRRDFERMQSQANPGALRLMRALH